MLGLPDGVPTCLFDLDGVLTDTPSVHGAAWKETFDAFEQVRAERDGTTFVPFDSQHDYEEYVDGNCAMRRSVISPAERGEIGGASLDPMANPEPKGNDWGP